MLYALIPKDAKYGFTMYRTNWKIGNSNINILVIGIVYEGVAFPILFKMMNKFGNSNSEERISLIDRFIKLFGKDCIMADREFVGEKWIGYLNGNSLRYYIRIGNNFKVFLPRGNETISVSWLFFSLKVGDVMHNPRIVKVNGVLCYL